MPAAAALAFALSTVAASGGLPPAAAAGKPARPRIVVLELAAERGLDAGLVRLLNELMLTGFQTNGELDVLGQSDIAAMVEQETSAQLAGCTEASCLAQIGSALGADLLAHGNIGRVGDFYLLNIKVIDTKRAVVVRRVSRQIAGIENQLIAALRESAVEAAGGEASRGAAAAAGAGSADGALIVGAIAAGTAALAVGAGVALGVLAQGEVGRAAFGNEDALERAELLAGGANVGYAVGVAGGAVAVGALALAAWE